MIRRFDRTTFHYSVLLSALMLMTFVCGCGTTLSRTATEQLLASDAVDRSIANIDFRDLSEKKVYFDTQYLKTVKGVGFVNADYIVSSLRQQMVAAELLLQDKKEDADYIIEARVGTLGTNGHEVTYGMPQSASFNTALNTAASMVPTMPAIPSMPELSFAKKNAELAAAKMSLFAYHRESKRPVWQSGVAQATSSAKDTWVFGAGPFQSGTIYDHPQFAGNQLRLPFFGRKKKEDAVVLVEYDTEHHFKDAGRVSLKPVESEPVATKPVPLPKPVSPPKKVEPKKPTPAKPVPPKTPPSKPVVEKSDVKKNDPRKENLKLLWTGEDLSQKTGAKPEDSKTQTKTAVKTEAWWESK